MTDEQKPKQSYTETMSFDATKLDTLQYVKVVYANRNKDLNEIVTSVKTLNNTTIELIQKDGESINLVCPLGVILKFVTHDAIYFAKVILNSISTVNRRTLLSIKAPAKMIRQQCRKNTRIYMERNCALYMNNGKSTPSLYIAKSVNISASGALIDRLEPLSNDDTANPIFDINSVGSIVLFLETDLLIPTAAKLVRIERRNDSPFRYAFQFMDLKQKYINPFYKYIVSSELKQLKMKP